MRALVAHYAELGYHGLSWEVWNEPDTGFWTGTLAQYTNLYRTTVEAVRSADPTAQVGGGGFANISSGFAAGFLDWYAANQSVPMDFLSWHHYSSNDFTTVTTTQNLLAARGIPAKRLHITEWNSTAAMSGGPGAGSDTNAGAAYAARRMSRALDSSALASVFWFSPMEGWTPTAGFNGDLGAITANGHRKAVGNVFEMYKGLAPQRLATTGGLSDRSLYGIATRDPERRRVTVLMWNNTTQSSRIDLELTGLSYAAAGQNFRAVRTLVDAANGNYYADFTAGGRGQRPGAHEYPALVQNQVLVPSERFAGPVNLPPNSVTLLVLSPTADGPPTRPSPVDNVAAARPVIASSSYDSPNQGWGVARLTDTMRHSIVQANAGQPTEGFTSTGYADAARTEWVQVDLGSARTFNRIALWPRDDQPGEGAGFPVDFTIAGTNTGGGPWQILHTATGYNGGGRVDGVQTFALPESSFRWVRLTATRLGVPVSEASGPTHRLQLAELELFRG